MRRRPHAVSSSGRLSCGQYTGEPPLFKQAGRCSVRFQMGGVDHHPVLGVGALRQLPEDDVENPSLTLAHKPVVQRLVWPIRRRRILPLQALPDHVNDPADYPQIIHPGNAMRDGEIWFDPSQLLPG